MVPPGSRALRSSRYNVTSISPTGISLPFRFFIISATRFAMCGPRVLMPIKATGSRLGYCRGISRAKRSRITLICSALRMRCFFVLEFFIGDSNDGFHQQLAAKPDILGVGPLHWIMADAPPTRHEDHPRWRYFRHLHGIVPRSRGHDLVNDSLFVADLPSEPQQAVVQRHRMFLSNGQNFNADVALAGDGACEVIENPRPAVFGFGCNA